MLRTKNVQLWPVHAYFGGFEIISYIINKCWEAYAVSVNNAKFSFNNTPSPITTP